MNGKLSEAKGFVELNPFFNDEEEKKEIEFNFQDSVEKIKVPFRFGILNHNLCLNIIEMFTNDYVDVSMRHKPLSKEKLKHILENVENQIPV